MLFLAIQTHQLSADAAEVGRRGRGVSPACVTP